MKVGAHPLAALIPTMSDDEFRELRDDIAANGLREPITIYEGKVLDGRHRARACGELGIEPAVREYHGDEPAAFVLSLNVKRRNLTPSQRAAVAVEFLPQLEEEARRRQVELGRERGGNPSAPRSQRVSDGHRAREDAGALVGVSGASVDRAKRIKREAPEDFERIKAGETTVRAVDNQIRESRRPKQAEAPAAPVEIKTDRQRQLAEGAKHRVEKAVGTCNGLARGVDGLRVERAMAVASPDEITGWDDSFRDAIAALKRIRHRLKETA